MLASERNNAWRGHGQQTHLCYCAPHSQVTDYMKEWHPLVNPGYGYELFKIWRTIFAEYRSDDR